MTSIQKHSIHKLINLKLQKNKNIMKNWNWKQWTSLGLVVAVFITCLVLHLVQPQVTYSFAELMTFVGAIVGFVAGYLFKRDRSQEQVTGDNSTQIQIGK